MEKRVWPCAMYEDGCDLWLVHGGANALYKRNNEGTIEFVTALAGEESMQDSAMCSVIEIYNVVYMIPSRGKFIHRFDIETNHDEIIHFKEEDKYISKRTFLTAYLKGEIIYCIPDEYEYIVAIDLKTNSLQYLYDIASILRANSMNAGYLSSSIMSNDYFLYLSIANNEDILKIDIKSNEIARIKGSVGGCITRSLAYIAESLYAIKELENGVNLIVRMEDGNVIKEINECVKITGIGDALLVDSVFGNWIMLLDEAGNELNEYIVDNATEPGLSQSYKHGLLSEGKRNSFYYCRKDNSLKRVLNDNSICLDGEQLRGYFPFTKEIFAEAIVEEKELVDLKTMISLL